MALARRTLASLPRRLHPSLSHLLPHSDRDADAYPAPASRRPLPDLYTPQSAGFRGLIREARAFAPHVPLGFEPSPRSYSSSSAGSNDAEYAKDMAGVFAEKGADVAEVLSEKSVEVAAQAAAVPAVGEVAAATADSAIPVAALQHAIDAVHSFTGLPWWASIAVTTVLIRSCTIPLLIHQLKATTKLTLLRPELEALKEQMENSMDPQSLQENQKRIKELFKKYGVTPFTPLKGIFIQGPVFISFYLGITNMVEKVPSFKEGGAFWFTDLTTPDPLYLLPILTGLTFLVNVELNMQEGLEGNPVAGTMKKFSRFFAFLTVPFTASFPKAIFCYWITSNLFSLTYGLVLKRPPVRRFLNLPEVSPQPTAASPPSFPFWGEHKQSVSATSSLPLPTKQSQSPERRKPSSSAISQRIRNLERTVKSRNRLKRR